MFSLDFTNKNLWVLFEIGGEKIYVTQTIRNTWVVMGVLIVVALIVRASLSKFSNIPRGFQNVVEALVETMDNFVTTTMGKSLEGFGGYFFSVFTFILVSNYSGLLGMRPPTADVATTAALASLTFILIHVTGFRVRKGKYLKSFLEPVAIFLPINIMGEIAKPISLTFRLFGNVLSGVIIMGLIYKMVPLVFRFVLPSVLHLYLDVFVGALQAFIFTVLSMTYITQTTTD